MKNNKYTEATIMAKKKQVITIKQQYMEQKKQ